jgi:sulfatase maturation enzyme AslB (radical SAM superfamily)
MTSQQLILQLQAQYNIVGVVDFSQWPEQQLFQYPLQLKKRLQQLHRLEYNHNDRVVLLFDHAQRSSGTVLEMLEYCQQVLNEVDISNFFVTLLICQSFAHIQELQERLHAASRDSVAIKIEFFDSTAELKTAPVFDNPNQQAQYLLTRSEFFCMLPWMHLYVQPDNAITPCCMIAQACGNASEQTLESAWNSKSIRQLRLNMLNDAPSLSCKSCYETAAHGLKDMRSDVNQEFAHLVDRVLTTSNTGHVEEFKLTKWDIRFSNICNLKCRTCSHSYSSQWYSDTKKLYPDYSNTLSLKAGRSDTDIWEQLLPHIDHVEHIYFAGGEPLLMDEHYAILTELERRKRFDVRLSYNTNFTNIDLKNRSVFDHWNQFQSVHVNASLDAAGLAGEYIRKGTDWKQIEHNRQLMQENCAHVTFAVTTVLSILNAWQVPDFHRAWVEQGLIDPDQIILNILIQAPYYRVDIAPLAYKQQLRHKYAEHITWLHSVNAARATVDMFANVVDFLFETDNSHLIKDFWNMTDQLDNIRNEHWKHALPELEALK